MNDYQWCVSGDRSLASKQARGSKMLSRHCRELLMPRLGRALASRLLPRSALPRSWYYILGLESYALPILASIVIGSLKLNTWRYHHHTFHSYLFISLFQSFQLQEVSKIAFVRNWKTAMFTYYFVYVWKKLSVQIDLVCWNCWLHLPRPYVASTSASSILPRSLSRPRHRPCQNGFTHITDNFEKKQ